MCPAADPSPLDVPAPTLGRTLPSAAEREPSYPGDYMWCRQVSHSNFEFYTQIDTRTHTDRHHTHTEKEREREK